ncbi:ABC transporter ATP-binding protein [Roseiarcaceae bacterium H3SJ34-1]|uniref:ABC transporter ATP-binding protein n=1 Tax=Terripilifer ovatus TaxID=3032367 RepID=UPI003AB9B968|nr:ABC transporter ATP-binding protein [Roseiarcaceae bacterium H3SJ34-1]
MADNSGVQAADALVKLRSVYKTYQSERGNVLALENVNLDIRQGEFLSLLGPSGCGKSTLLRCLAGLERISSGEVWVRGNELAGPPEDLGIVFQRDMLLDWRTVLDNVLLPLEFLRRPTKGYVEPALKLLETFGLRRSADRYPWELSGGMRQRVAICRALLSDPALLLMDEPFGALDAITRDNLNIELQRIWTQTHKTILFITHSISEAILLSNRVAVMARDPGRIEEIVEVDLPWPRTLAMRETPEFIHHAAAVRKIFERLGAFTG